jgi:hypothetical protein
MESKRKREEPWGAWNLVVNIIRLICRFRCQEAWMSGSWVCSGGRSSCARSVVVGSAGRVVIDGSVRLIFAG